MILVTGTIALSFSLSSFITAANAQGQPSYYNVMDNSNYKKSYDKDNRDKSKDSNSVIVKKINCNNINVNVNGLELIALPTALNSLLTGEAQATDEGQYGASSYGSSGGESGYDNNLFKFVCINNNNNTVIGGEQPPTPLTQASLTVKKQVFGCITFSTIEMNCLGLQNNSPEWLDCNNPNISGSIFCQSLPESIFDIEVLDDQNIPIQQFEGSEQGTTIQNLEPGTYTVNEIKHLANVDQLGENVIAEAECISAGFPDGGVLVNLTTSLVFDICFEYEDEQGNDCSTITLAAGEERTCIVKNYIRFAEGI